MIATTEGIFTAKFIGTHGFDVVKSILISGKVVEVDMRCFNWILASEHLLNFDLPETTLRERQYQQVLALVYCRTICVRKWLQPID